MFGWLKKLFSDDSAPTLETPVATPTAESKPRTTTKNKSSANTGRKPASKTADVDAMTKTQLLEHAKKKGVKVNASMKKADLVKKIKNA